MRGIIDMHCDTISALYDKEKRENWYRFGRIRGMLIYAE